MSHARRLGALLALVLLTAGCIPGAGPRYDISEYFTDEAHHELAAAVANGDAEKVDELVAGGADPDAQGVDDRTMLQWALLTDSLDGFVALLDAGADPDKIGYRGEAALHEAAEHPTTAFIDALVEAGADVDVANPHTGATALQNTCLQTRPENLAALIAAGADVTHVDRTGATALHTCGAVNRGDMALMLLEAGADPMVESSSGATFQDNYFGYDTALLSEEGLERRAAVAEWLRDNGYPVPPEA